MLVNGAINVLAPFGQGILDGNELGCRQRLAINPEDSRLGSVRVSIRRECFRADVAAARSDRPFLKRGQNLDRPLIRQPFRVFSQQQDSFHFVVAK